MPDLHDIDIATDVPATPAAAPLLRAQAIDCGGLLVAVPFGWARSVVERFEISQVPNAPVWLAGAVNVDGRIVALLDLAAWLDDGNTQIIGRHSKLLVGGAGDEAFALLFQGLPLLARYASDTRAADANDLPDALLPYVTGRAHIANDKDARPLPLVDAAALGRTWLAELAV